MTPQIKAKFRKRNGVPYSIERLTGTQFRCRMCNTVFLKENDLNRHLLIESRSSSSRKIDKSAPKLHEMVNCRIYYGEDYLDALKSVKLLWLKSGDDYDGMLKKKKMK